jgi:hypothetical protein
MVPLALAFSHPRQEVLDTFYSCLQILDVFRPAVRLCEPHDGPCLPSAPRGLISPTLVRHLCLRPAISWVKVHEMVTREVWSQDFVDDGIRMLSSNVNERLIIPKVSNEV